MGGVSFFQSFKFQFHYGTIKSVSLADKWYVDANFNSTMVRLKVQYLRDYKNASEFQFHYGTIKSKPSEYRYCSNVEISIPLWYD